VPASTAVDDPAAHRQIGRDRLVQAARAIKRERWVASLEAALTWVENTGIATSWSVVSTLPCVSRALAPGADHQIVWQAQELLPAADERHALRRTVRRLASACGLLREGDLRSWLKPWGHDPASVLRELSESGDVEAFAVTAGSVVYVTTAARPDAERALEEEPR
jgi:hypothetical protein